MILKIIPVCPASFASNCYVLISGGHAVVIDPSVSVGAILDTVKNENATLDAVLLTHGHFDHIVSIDTLRDKLDIRVMIHENDAEMLTDGSKNAFFTLFGRNRTYRPAEATLSDGDEIKLGDELIKVIHTPGHSKGSVCFLGDTFIVTGDTLFSDSIGRYDLYGGDPAALASSLERLSECDKNLKIYPGHGECELLGHALDNVAYFRR